MGIATQIAGNTDGLKANQRDRLQRIYRRTVSPEQVITPELAQYIASASRDLRRQIGLLIDRRGRIAHVVVGDTTKLFLPELGRQRAGRSRFRGLRLVHTHIQGERLSRDDLTDLSKLQLDMIAVLQVNDEGLPTTIELAHLIPKGPSGALWEIIAPAPFHTYRLDFDVFIADLEGQFATYRRTQASGEGLTAAIAVHLATGAPNQPSADESIAELRELARTAGIALVEVIVQRRRTPDPRYVIGRGKLDELLLASIQQEAELIVFDCNLNPSQVRSIADVTEAKVIDRTQLILDIFAQRATTADGKLQVELAQLKYMLPRLAGKNTAMSRLTGGIGGRGPGETKLEIDRRRAQNRITHLQKDIKRLAKQRGGRRRRRDRSGIPTVAIVGYTNAGKSTLLNALTGSTVLAEDKLFATLDPTTRRLRFPDEQELVLTDTVGFIRDLPEDLVTAFKATLEELVHADVLLHVVDLSAARWEDRMASVDAILEDLGVQNKPRVVVFNKMDQVDEPETIAPLCRRFEAVAVSALDRATFESLTERLIQLLPSSSEATRG
ncbi:MAG: GTPase HflX [Myxococcota bacterium]